MGVGFVVHNHYHIELYFRRRPHNADVCISSVFFTLSSPFPETEVIAKFITQPPLLRLILK